MIEITVYLYDQMMERVNIFFRYCGTPMHWVPSKHVCEQRICHVIFKDFMPFLGAYNANHVSNQGYLSTIVCFT